MFVVVGMYCQLLLILVRQLTGVAWKVEMKQCPVVPFCFYASFWRGSKLYASIVGSLLDFQQLGAMFLKVRRRASLHHLLNSSPPKNRADPRLIG